MPESIINSSKLLQRAVFVGLSTVDLTYRIENLPGPDAKASALSQHIGVGGPATNAAITFSFLGGRSALVSAVGKHPLATIIRDELGQFSVCLRDLASGRGEAPPISSILVLPRGERTIISANAKVFDGIALEPEATCVDGAEIVLVDGHYMSTCQGIATLARQKGIEVVFDGGSWKHGTRDLLPNIGTAICSSGFRPPGCRDEWEVLSFLRDQEIERIAITRGPESILYANKSLIAELPIPHIDANDTNGAGDIFHGAFCCRFSQPDRDFMKSLQFAASVATFSCKYPDTRSWMLAFAEARIGF